MKPALAAFAAQGQSMTRPSEVAEGDSRQLMTKLALAQAQLAPEDLVSLEASTGRKAEDIFDDLALQRENGFLDVTFIAGDRDSRRESYFQSPATDSQPAGVTLDLTGMNVDVKNPDSLNAGDAKILLLELAQLFQANRIPIKTYAGIAFRNRPKIQANL